MSPANRRVLVDKGRSQRGGPSRFRRLAKLTQAAAAALLGLSQSDVSKVLKGRPRPISLERLMRCLVAMGQSVAIDVGPPAKQTRPSIRMTVR
jgi:transcriptional regulator with XRE-family HTH domain